MSDTGNPARSGGLCTSNYTRSSRDSRCLLANYTDPMLPGFFDSVLSLIVRTSTDLPPDVRSAMKVAMAQEPSDTQSGQALAIIAQNIDLAADGEGAICQDTGMPTFEVSTPVGGNQIEMRRQIR